MEKILIACATDDGEHFVKRHFGDAEKYFVYQYDVDNKSFDFITEVHNSKYDEEKDGHSKKAGFIASKLKPLGVNVLANMALGTNVVPMRKKFAIIISRIENIKECLSRVDMNAVAKEVLLESGIEKKIIYVK